MSCNQVSYSDETTIVIVKVVPAISIRPVLEPVDIPRPEHSSSTYCLSPPLHALSVVAVFYGNKVAVMEVRITQLLIVSHGCQDLEF